MSRRATRAAANVARSAAHSVATRETVRLRQALVSIEVGAAVMLLLAADATAAKRRSAARRRSRLSHRPA